MFTIYNQTPLSFQAPSTVLTPGSTGQLPYGSVVLTSIPAGTAGATGQDGKKFAGLVLYTDPESTFLEADLTIKDNKFELVDHTTKQLYASSVMLTNYPNTTLRVSGPNSDATLIIPTQGQALLMASPDGFKQEWTFAMVDGNVVATKKSNIFPRFPLLVTYSPEEGINLISVGGLLNQAKNTCSSSDTWIYWVMGLVLILILVVILVVFLVR